MEGLEGLGLNKNGIVQACALTLFRDACILAKSLVGKRILCYNNEQPIKLRLMKNHKTESVNIRRLTR